MQNRFLKLCSIVLVLAMLCNMLPMTGFAQMLPGSLSSDTEAALQPQETAQPAEVVAELTEKRTEYTKEFLLSNGLRMATVYADPIHYQKDGAWEEIDNTLKTTRNGTVTNTAGVWNVSFPQQLGGSNSVTIEKDGYTLSFYMAGELRSSGELMTAAIGTQPTEQLAVTQLQTATAAVQQLDQATIRDGYEHEEAAPEKLYSQLRYDGVYQNTDILYDLQSNTVKESIVMGAYSDTLRGYRYTLNVGQLVPVLEDGQITFYGSGKEEAVMVMPAPYLLDANAEFNDDIQVQLTGGNGTYTLTYLLPTQWLAAADRAWPVILDPVVNASRQKVNIQDRTVCSETGALSASKTVLNAGYSTKNGIMRSYVKFNDLPFLTSSDVVVEAVFKLYKVEDSSASKTVEAHKVTQDWNEQNISWDTQPQFDTEITDFIHVQNKGWYWWKVTDIVRSWYIGDNHGLMIRMSDDVESRTTDFFRQFYSSNTGSAHRPILQVYFLNNNGYESYWNYTTTSAGRAGMGYVNNFTGNMTWIRNDMSFSGSQRPVSITHVYNANDAIVPVDRQFALNGSDDTPEVESNNSNDSGGNYFGLGIGWRTNYHQRVFQWACSDASNASKYYVWEDEDGTDHYFEKNSAGDYVEADNLQLTLTVKTDGYEITDEQDNTRYFDSQGRLIRDENNQEKKHYITIAYRSDTSVQIDTITDGVGRIYEFEYDDDDLLESIRCVVGEEQTVLYEVRYTYTDSLLTEIIDNVCNKTTECEKCTKNETNKHIFYSYNDDGILESATDIDGFTVRYAYNRDADAASSTADWEQPYYVTMISTEDDGSSGGSLSFEYGYNETVITDHKGNQQTLQFNDQGNVNCVMDDEGHAQYGDYTVNSHSETGTANQLRFSSKLQNTVSNLLPYGGFETGNDWVRNATTMEVSRTTEEAHTGSYSLKLTVSEASSLNSAHTDRFQVQPGETVTYSAYVLVPQNTGSLMLSYKTATSAATYLGGPAVQASDQWQRLQMHYTNTSDEVQLLRAFFCTREVGTYYIDSTQVEKSSTASRYNLVENGDFRFSSGWTDNSNCTEADGIVTLSEGAPTAPQLDAQCYKISGSRTKTKTVAQTLELKGEEGDSFVLSGWAKGYSAPAVTYDAYTRRFAVRARFKYTDNTNSDYFYATFNPSTRQWQYASTAMVAKKDYQSVTVEIVYHNNVNTIYFDGIQLFQEEFGSSYTYDENGNVASSVDLQKKRTEYQYDADGNLTQILEDNKAKVTYTYYEDSHNVKTAVTEEGLKYSFEYDEWGNNTKVSIGSGETTISSSATYKNDGKFLDSSTDALGKTTYYGYNVDTGVLEWVQYPNDSEATRTEYTYDSMYRQAAAACETDTGLELSANYTFDGDYLTTIETPTTTYHFAYGTFGLRQSVTVGNQTLATYSYNGDWDLQRQTYGNGDYIGYTYDDKGRPTAETHVDMSGVGDTATQVDSFTVEYFYDNDGNLASVRDGATGITTTQYYDLLGRPMKYVENNGTKDIHSVEYDYNGDNNLETLTEKIGNTELLTEYAYDDDNRVTSVTTDGTTVEYTYDSYGRVSKQETKNRETTILTEEFTYTGNTTAKTTSTQIATYKTTAGGNTVTYSYEYDNNGNITSVVSTTSNSDGTNSSSYTTAYVYDSANQLIRENNQAGNFTHTWTYDNAGNILERKEYAYTTGDLSTATRTVSYDYPTDPENNTVWGDLLTSYDGTAITYDRIGNPETFGSRTYTWEHGRQLKSLTEGSTTWTYTYDAGGLRTGRTNGTSGGTYAYTYTGSQLTQMKKGTSNTLTFTYDASGTPLTVTWNGVKYYYATNIQGDVVAILNSNGSEVGTYTYDAWGNCTVTGTASVMQLNPLRYRGYVYDQETGLYYLQSRYYDPEIGRFVNADDIAFLGADGTPLSNNLFAYGKNNPIMGYDPTGHWSWSLFTKIAVTTVVVAACLTGVGAIAAAAAAATATSVTAAVTVAVTSAGISTALSAVDGAICAQQSGGDWRDGAMAGAVGGAVGSLVSSATSPAPGSDSALRMNTAGRAASSATFDITYELYSTGKISSSSIAMAAADVTMDTIIAPVSYYYTGNISNDQIRAAINGLIDGAIDVFQTKTLFS